MARQGSRAGAPWRRVGPVAFTAAALAACSTQVAQAPPAPPPASIEDRFGAGFGQDFRAPPDAQPAPVKDGDVIPPDPTAVPEPL
jgi:hypothetical protein